MNRRIRLRCNIDGYIVNTRSFRHMVFGWVVSALLLSQAAAFTATPVPHAMKHRASSASSQRQVVMIQPSGNSDPNFDKDKVTPEASWTQRDANPSLATRSRTVEASDATTDGWAFESLAPQAEDGNWHSRRLGFRRCHLRTPCSEGRRQWHQLWQRTWRGGGPGEESPEEGGQQ